MKRIIGLTIILSFYSTLNSYGMIEKWGNSNNFSFNTWYYSYLTDDFNDDTNEPYLVCAANGTFSNTIETNADCGYVLSYMKYIDGITNTFLIGIIEYRLLPFQDYTGMFKASIKYNGEIYEYPYVLYVYKFKDLNFIAIPENLNAELYHTLLYLLTSQTSFKLRLEKYSSIGTNYNNSYICEIPATNFSEVYNAIYTNANN